MSKFIKNIAIEDANGDLTNHKIALNHHIAIGDYTFDGTENTIVPNEALGGNRELTLAEYQALTEEEKMNGLTYFITDINGEVNLDDLKAENIYYDNTLSKLNANNVNAAIDELSIKTGLPAYKITEAVDFNTLNATGIYHIINANCANAPEATHGTLYVDFEVDVKYQIFTPDSAMNYDYKRVYENNKWSAWTKRNSTYNKASATEDGLMSAEDKVKLDNFETLTNYLSYKSTYAGNIDDLHGREYCGGYWVRAVDATGTLPWTDNYFNIYIPIELNGRTQYAQKYDTGEMKARSYNNSNSSWNPWTSDKEAFELQITQIESEMSLLKLNLNNKADSNHDHGSDYYSATKDRTANYVLAAPNGSKGVASFRKLVEADLPEHTHSYEGAVKPCMNTKLTESMALISNTAGNISAASGVTSTELKTLAGINTSKTLKAQLDAKQDIITGTLSNYIDKDMTASMVVTSNSSGKLSTASGVTTNEIKHLSGVKSSVQDQLDGKTTPSSFVTKMFTIANTTINANEHKQLEVNIAYSGYKPIGLAGFNSGQTMLAIPTIAFSASSDTCVITLSNLSSSSKTTNGANVAILFVKE